VTTVEPALLALVLLALAVAVAGFLLGRRRPGALLVVWLLVVCFVPIWVEVRVLLPWSAASGIALLAAATFVSRGLPRVWSLADLLMCFLFLWALSPFLVGRLSLASLAGVLSVWIAGYGLGRIAPIRIDLHWIYGAVAVAFTGVAVLAVIEFVTGWHGLASWGPANATRESWQQIQVRSGLERSEGAFGHSIALGASLALALVLTIESRFRPWIRVLMLLIMLTAIAITLSRTSLVCAALGIGLSIVFLRSPLARSVRRALVVLAVGGAAVLVPFILGVLGASDEAEGSAAYRGNLLSLVPYFRLFGVSDALEISATGRVYFAGFRSIDSQLVLFGLSYGWITLGFVVLMLALAVIQTLRGRAQAPTIAIVAQIPALATVALITQYHIFFWFVAGLAVAAEAIGPRPSTIGPVPRARSVHPLHEMDVRR
jgi:hypothetical protein